MYKFTYLKPLYFTMAQMVKLTKSLEKRMQKLKE